MDQIIIENLQVYAHHGVYREENEKGQNFYINAVLETDTRRAGTLDDLDLSTNYGEVCVFMDRFVREHTYKLIETVAERTAEALLLRFPLIRQVTLEVRKPEAPIALPFESVSVKITRGWRRAYLSCGSNMGDRKAHLDQAVAELRADGKCRVLKVSGWIETAPYGGVAQENFLNGAIMMETLYTPRMLLEKVHEIEQAHGRERKVHWGPRTLDLDIVLYEGCVMHTEELVIPHADMHNRLFVLEPLAQIAPCERHPLTGETVGQMYARVGKENFETADTAAQENREEKIETPEAAKMQGTAERIKGTEPCDKQKSAAALQTRKLTLEQARAIYEDCAKKDFPPEEIKPFAVIEAMWKKGLYRAYGFYEELGRRTDNPEKQGRLCAYAFLLANNEKRALLLDYFAVISDNRGSGIGSAALPLLKEACADGGILVIEVEDDELDMLDEKTRMTRQRRISFYEKAGCVMTDTRSRVFGVDYRIMALPLSDKETPGRMAERVRALYGSMYPDEIMQKQFAITAE